MRVRFSTLFDYISNAVKYVDLDFDENDQYFDFENIPKLKYDKSFHILNNAITPVLMDGLHVEDNCSFELRLYFKTKKNNRPEVMAYLDTGLDIADRLVDRELSNVGEYIKNVTINSIDNEYQASNDNALIIRISLNILTAHSYRS